MRAKKQVAMYAVWPTGIIVRARVGKSKASDERREEEKGKILAKERSKILLSVALSLSSVLS